ncbi:MAG: M43 family zinc metalloprotease [Candidatus Zixiibacteriota bacterium]
MKLITHLIVILTFILYLICLAGTAVNAEEECLDLVTQDQLSVDSARIAANWVCPANKSLSQDVYLPLSIHIIVPTQEWIDDYNQEYQDSVTMDDFGYNLQELDTLFYYLNHHFTNNNTDIEFYLYDENHLDTAFDAVYFYNPYSQYEESLVYHFDSMMAKYGAENAVNVYCITGGGWRGFSYLPEHNFHGIALSYISPQKVNQKTLAHEMGHYFGLYHPFETYFGYECPDGGNCDSTGDLICDTEASPDLVCGQNATDYPYCTYTGTTTAPPPCDTTDTYNPDVDNLMTYGCAACCTEFTSGQINRMQFYLTTDTLPLYDSLFPECSDSLAWEHKYGGFGNDSAYAVIQASDGGFVMAGSMDQFGADYGNALYVVKTNACGRVEWNKSYGTTGEEVAYSVMETYDGGFVVVGKTDLGDPHDLEVLVVKFDANGDTLWSQNFGGGYDQVGYSIKQTSDSGFIAAGYSGWLSNLDFYLAKLDYDGTLLWDSTYGGNSQEIGYCVEQTNDDGYIISGFTRSYGAGNQDFYLVKTDSYGALSWDTTYGGSGNDVAYAVKQTSDSGYIVAGFTESYGIGGKDWYIVRTGASGSVTWDTTFGSNGDDIAYDIELASSGGFVIGGSGQVVNDKGKDYLIKKISSSGSVYWSQAFGGVDDEICRSVDICNDGSIIIAGYSDAFCMGGTDCQLIRFEDISSFVCGDVNASGTINMQDILYLIDYLYYGGPAPYPLESGDVDCNGVINLLDYTYLYNYVYRSGPAPCANCD